MSIRNGWEGTVVKMMQTEHNDNEPDKPCFSCVGYVVTAAFCLFHVNRRLHALWLSDDALCIMTVIWTFHRIV